MPTVIATVGATDANSYVTRAEATTILDSFLNVSEWSAATNDDKDRAIIQATSMLDRMMYWEGVPTTTTQALRWPRYGAYNEDMSDEYDSDAIPTPIKQGTSLLAVFLLRRDRLAEPDILGQGISQGTLGPMSATVDKTQVLPFIPDSVQSLISHLGQLSSSANRSPRMHTIRLVRS